MSKAAAELREVIRDPVAKDGGSWRVTGGDGMHRQTLHRTLFLSLLAVPASLPAQPGDSTNVDRCFVLTIGAWTRPLGEDAKFHVPADTIRLTRDTLADWKGGWLRAEPPIRHRYENGAARAGWMAIDESSFRVSWGDGHAGASLQLFRGDRGYYGVIRALSDARVPERAVPKALVDANEIACRAVGASPGPSD